uniref:Aldo keto reductase n=1 Tax=Melanopsichium pennsylvanicum 4 TaxID=1398559 RepID=A0A077R6Y4_9BASI|nr:aldo keto reductase [Melanopsichium pennsylvanicum 4]
MTAQNITNNLILASKARLADNNLIPRLGLGVKRRLECWKTIEEAKDQGLIRSIGVSNYGESYIKELLDFSFKHKPVANQCDLHSFMARSDLVEYCLSQDITLEIPKSVSEQGIIENAHVFGFELDEQDVEQLDRLDVYLVTE